MGRREEDSSKRFKKCAQNTNIYKLIVDGVENTKDFYENVLYV